MKRARLISRSGKYTCIFPTFRKTRNTRRPCKAGGLFVCLKHTLKKKGRAFRIIGKRYFPGREISLIALFWIIKNFLTYPISRYQRKFSKFFKIMKGGINTTTTTGQKNFTTFCEMLESLKQHDNTKRQTVSKKKMGPCLRSEARLCFLRFLTERILGR